MQTSTCVKTGVVLVLSLLACGVSQAFAEGNTLTDTDFQKVGSKYGVSPYLLLAVSEVESQHGELLGKHKVSEVINPSQFKYLKKIARHTGRDIAEFTGSYAGAMGQMQIVPSTFYTYAQDGNGDGIKDPLNPHDSLATAAYYLAREISVKNSVRSALRGYNNSSAYCNLVLKRAKTLELESTFAAKQ